MSLDGWLRIDGQIKKHINSMASFIFRDWIEWRPFHNDRPWPFFFFFFCDLSPHTTAAEIMRFPFSSVLLLLFFCLAQLETRGKVTLWMTNEAEKEYKRKCSTAQHSTAQGDVLYMRYQCVPSFGSIEATGPVPYRVCQNGHALSRDAEISWYYTLAATLCAAIL